MKIIDKYARINGNVTPIDTGSDFIEILGEDDRQLFNVRLKGNILEVDAGIMCKIKGVDGEKIYDSTLLIKPIAGNIVQLIKPEYKG